MINQPMHSDTEANPANASALSKVDRHDCMAARPAENPALLRQLTTGSPVGFWNAPVAITENNFIYKSLSNWAFNIAVGCSHGCRFCYVPDTATRKQAPHLKGHGVKDPDAEWGKYVLLRPGMRKNFSLHLPEQKKLRMRRSSPMATALLSIAAPPTHTKSITIVIPSADSC